MILVDNDGEFIALFIIKILSYKNASYLIDTTDVRY